MDWMPILTIAIAFILLLLASWSDWRTRMASDVSWIIMGTLGLILLTYQIYQDGVSPLYYLFLFPLAVFFYDIFWDRPGLFEKEGEEIALALYISAFIVLGTLLLLFHNDEYFWKMLYATTMGKASIVAAASLTPIKLSACPPTTNIVTSCGIVINSL